jgi:hypothetical protein
VVTSSFSQGNSNCVDIEFHKAAGSGSNGNCVEVAHVADEFHVRDTKLGDNSPVLLFTPDEWRAFIQGVKAGEFDHGLFEQELING